MRFVGLIFAVQVAWYTEGSSDIYPGSLALECQNTPPPKIHAVGNLMPQYFHGIHDDNQDCWRKHQPWPS